MGRPVTLFTGQWADLKLEDLCKKAREFGYDGLELACWGDHFEVDKALSDDTYCAGRRDLLERHDLKLFSISAHLVGQAVCDRIDERHKAILPEYVWGDGDPEGINERAIEEMKNTARAAQKLGVSVVNGFTGSSIWHLLYDFPPTPRPMIEAASSSSPTGSTRSWTSSRNAASGSPWKSIRPRSPSTSTPPIRRWKRSAGGRSSASTSIRAT
jgi:hypothetical protein